MRKGSTSRLLVRQRETFVDLPRLLADGTPYLLRVFYDRIDSRMTAEAGSSRLMMMNVARKAAAPEAGAALEKELIALEAEMDERVAALETLPEAEQPAARDALASLRPRQLDLVESIREAKLDAIYAAALAVFNRSGPGDLADNQVAIVCAGVRAWHALDEHGKPELRDADGELVQRERVKLVPDREGEDAERGIYHISALDENEIAVLGQAIYEHASGQGRQAGLRTLARFREGGPGSSRAPLGNREGSGEVPARGDGA